VIVKSILINSFTLHGKQIKISNHNNPLDKHAALMILHELLGKPPYVPKKAKLQKSPVPPRKKSDDIPGTGAAIDRVRSQLRRDALKAREPTTKLSFKLMLIRMLHWPISKYWI
jgi:ATP-dependent helicase YprA (DUF1998 family)